MGEICTWFYLFVCLCVVVCRDLLCDRLRFKCLIMHFRNVQLYIYFVLYFVMLKVYMFNQSNLQL